MGLDMYLLKRNNEFSDAQYADVYTKNQNASRRSSIEGLKAELEACKTYKQKKEWMEKRYPTLLTDREKFIKDPTTVGFKDDMLFCGNGFYTNTRPQLVTLVDDHAGYSLRLADLTILEIVDLVYDNEVKIVEQELPKVKDAVAVETVGYYEEEVMYWRKAWHIQDWISDNVAPVENCEFVSITIDNLNDLQAWCKEELKDGDYGEWDTEHFENTIEKIDYIVKDHKPNDRYVYYGWW